MKRPLRTIEEGLAVVPLSERSLRRALAPGGDLEFMAVRVGRRVFIKGAALDELVGANKDEDAPDTQESATG